MSLSRLQQQKARLSKVSEISQPSNKISDARFWRLQPDENLNSSAVIRFLPRPLDDRLKEDYDYADDFVRVITHWYKGKNGEYYTEMSRRTWNQPDPVTNFNSELYNRNKDLANDIVYTNGGTRRKVTYYSNIYIIDDPISPENNGKVFLFRFGNAIMKMLEEVASPTIPSRRAMNPFNIFEGPNFEIVTCKKSTFLNYDNSSFDKTPSTLDEDEAKLESVLEKCYSLREFIDVKQMKSYEDLEKSFIRVMGDGYWTHRGITPPSDSPVVNSTTEIPVVNSTTKDMTEEEIANYLV